MICNNILADISHLLFFIILNKSIHKVLINAVITQLITYEKDNPASLKRSLTKGIYNADKINTGSDAGYQWDKVILIPQCFKN